MWRPRRWDSSEADGDGAETCRAELLPAVCSSSADAGGEGKDAEPWYHSHCLLLYCFILFFPLFSCVSVMDPELLYHFLSCFFHQFESVCVLCVCWRMQRPSISGWVSSSWSSILGTSSVLVMMFQPSAGWLLRWIKTDRLVIRLTGALKYTVYIVLTYPAPVRLLCSRRLLPNYKEKFIDFELWLYTLDEKNLIVSADKTKW